METYNEVLNNYNLKVGDKIKSNVGGYVDDLEIVKAIKLKDGSIKLVIRPERPYPNHPNYFNVDIDEAIKFAAQEDLDGAQIHDIAADQKADFFAFLP